MDLGHNFFIQGLPATQAGGSSLTSLVSLLLAAALLSAAVFLVRRLRHERTERLEELEALSQIQESIASTPPDPAEIAETTYVMAARLLETDFFQLGVFDNGSYRTLIWIKDGDRQDNVSFPLAEGEQGIVGWVRRSGEPLIVTDFEAQRESLPATPSYTASDPPVAGLFVPVKAGERVIGEIIVQSRRRAAFSQHHLQLLSHVASAVAAALTAMGFERQLDDRRRQLGLLAALSRELIALQPLPERYTRIASMISRLFDDSEVRLFEYRDGAIELRAAWPVLDSASPAAAPSPTIEQVVRERARSIRQTPNEHGGSRHTELAIPLEADDRLLGVLELSIPDGRGLSYVHIELASLLGTQLGVALSEMQAYSQQQEYTWITTVLLEVARHASQPGDVEAAIQAVLQLTTLLVGTAWAMVLLPDDSGGELRVGPMAGPRRQVQDRLGDLRLPAAAFELGAGLTEGVPRGVVLPAALADPLGALEGTCIPLSDGTKLLGILLVDGRAYHELRLSLLGGIAHQLSLRIENTLLMEQAAVRRSLENELAVARSIQESFLPKAMPTYEGWEVGTVWRVARSVGGDFYDFIPLSPGPEGPRWGVVIADVADKGVPAALFMALCRTLLRSVAISRVDPGLTLKRMNEIIFADTQTDLFVSVFYAVWEPRSSHLTYANGGHNPPILFTRGMHPRSLAEHGMVLGVSKGQNYQSHTVTLPRDSALIFYTDGLTEATARDGMLFGTHRLIKLVQDLDDWGADNLAHQIQNQVMQFVGEPDPPDDMTAVILRRTG